MICYYYNQFLLWAKSFCIFTTLFIVVVWIAWWYWWLSSIWWKMSQSEVKEGISKKKLQVCKNCQQDLTIFRDIRLAWLANFVYLFFIRNAYYLDATLKVKKKVAHFTNILSTTFTIFFEKRQGAFAKWHAQCLEHFFLCAKFFCYVKKTVNFS